MSAMAWQPRRREQGGCGGEERKWRGGGSPTREVDGVWRVHGISGDGRDEHELALPIRSGLGRSGSGREAGDWGYGPIGVAWAYWAGYASDLLATQAFSLPFIFFFFHLIKQTPQF